MRQRPCLAAGIGASSGSVEFTAPAQAGHCGTRTRFSDIRPKHPFTHPGKHMSSRHRLFFVLLALSAAACGEKSDPAQPPNREAPRGFTVQEVTLADASVGFGLRLYQ